MSAHPADAPELPEPDWPSLVARVRDGDQAAFGTIFRAFVLPLCAFASRSVRSRDTAAELVQDVFYRIWRGHATWDVPGNLKSYLYRATRNRVLDHLKHERIASRWAERSYREHAAEVARSDTSMEHLLDSNDMAVALEQALAELPERRRLVFLLRWREGLSHKEIAQRLGVSTKTVENQLTRAIRTLRERLGPGHCEEAQPTKQSGRPPA